MSSIFNEVTLSIIPPKNNDHVVIDVMVEEIDHQESAVKAICNINGEKYQIDTILQKEMANGYVGIFGQGLMDFEVQEFTVYPGGNQPRKIQPLDCHACYPLGDTLKQKDGKWSVRFVSMFASKGEKVEIRISDNPNADWGMLPSAGTGKIVDNEWRRHTAVVTALLPFNPASTTMYFTVWKDGINVTSDPRIGSQSVGDGTGLVGDVPTDGNYIGRLPRLSAPYKLCGLSCHAIWTGLQRYSNDKGWYRSEFNGSWQIRDQPTENAFGHLEEFDFQIMLWEDDIWYLESLFFPASTDDAYKIITHTICGPTSRWQLMRHWNVLNPGDHDYGMDDIKGPEQLLVRTRDGLGQDITYMQRNFKIVHLLTRGKELDDPTKNPKMWRSWKMPNKDFTLCIMDPRLWRSSQDVDIWDDSGWPKIGLYSRKDPTRTLLGEEQFAWFKNLLSVDSSKLICVSGLNALHTIWAQGSDDDPFNQKDRSAADYAGWVFESASRVLNLISQRQGVVSIYGDVHNGVIIKNTQLNVVECAFGPIGTNSGRKPLPGFGRTMKDYDGRNLDVYAFYHARYSDPELSPHEPGAPHYWNFLEAMFDPRSVDPFMSFKIRNLLDSPMEPPRGGGHLEIHASETGQKHSSIVPPQKTDPNADVRFETLEGFPILAVRSDSLGNVSVTPLVKIEPGIEIIMTTFTGNGVRSTIVTTEAVVNK